MAHANKTVSGFCTESKSEILVPELTDKQKSNLIRERLKKIDETLEDPNLTEEVERELFFQQDKLTALYIRLDLDTFMADIGYRQ